MTEKVRTEVLGEVFVVTIARPEVRNCVDRETAEALAAAFRRFDADDALRVAILQGEGPRGQILVTARSVLASVQAPDLDRHVAIAVPFSEQTEAGFPGERSLDALRALEDHLVDRLGSGGQLLAHATAAGVRTLHFYVDGAGPGEEVLRTASSGWTEGAVVVEAEHDPGWQAVAPFRG